MRNVSRTFAWTYLLFASALILGSCSTPQRPDSPVLTKLDYDLERSDRASGPALSSGIGDPHPFKSYNEWQCFDSKKIELGTAEIEYGHLKQIPNLLASSPGRELDFAPEGDDELNTPHAMMKLKKLLQGSASVCVYAALLQKEVSKNGQPVMEIWILQRVKTKKSVSGKSPTTGLLDRPNAPSVIPVPLRSLLLQRPPRHLAIIREPHVVAEEQPHDPSIITDRWDAGR